jgi:predicted nucleic acid-binding protein
MTKPLLILDSSPLITLSLFPIPQPAIETVLQVSNVVVVETVAVETTAFLHHRDAVVIKRLLQAKRITPKAVPVTAVDKFIDNYSKVDVGERDTIRLALTMPEARLVLDDVAAFIIATHFDLSPIMLLDLIVGWVRTGLIAKSIALKMVSAMSSRYSEAFVNHTKYRISEV